jgi:hypothetical protein
MISYNWIPAICQTMFSMGPDYATNIFKWIKSAIWDAPHRVWLDIELQKIALDREDWRNNQLYPSDDEDDEPSDETPKSD